MRKTVSWAWAFGGTAALITACGAPPPEVGGAAAPGGETTVADRSSSAYSNPAANLDDDALALHLAGDVAFEAKFVTAPATINPGLGPVYNNVSCASCHLRDGRGIPTLGAGPLRSQLLVRVSLPEGHGTPAVPGDAVPVPGLGLQLQDQAIFGVTPEALIELTWIEEPGRFGDGTSYSLRRPTLTITLADGTPLPAHVRTSLRQPPPVFGLGLLEAVSDEAILASADPDDADGDGISGRANMVWSLRAGGARVGRFGHKANTPDLEQQAGAAYANDMGVLNPRFPGDGPEIDEDTLVAAAFYTRTLAVPARAPHVSAAARRGERLFAQFGCAACHSPTLTSDASPFASLADQSFAPYTDLLIHDMGEGLADGRPDFLAEGREWRTAPLWGLGLVQTVAPGAGYLHDGRARTPSEAILWHGGEAEAAREAYRTANAQDRDALLAFLLLL